MRIPLVAVAAALAVGFVVPSAATAVPPSAQAKKIKALQAHIAKQNRAIAARNTVIAERDSAIAGLELQVSALTTDRDGVAKAAEVLRAQLVNSATDQINVMPPDDAWKIVPVIAARISLSCFYDTSVFFGGGGYTSWSLTRTWFCL